MLKQVIQGKGKITEIAHTLHPFVRYRLQGIIQRQKIIYFFRLQAVCLRQVFMGIPNGGDFSGLHYQRVGR